MRIHARSYVFPSLVSLSLPLASPYLPFPRFLSYPSSHSRLSPSFLLPSPLPLPSFTFPVALHAYPPECPSRRTSDSISSPDCAPTRPEPSSAPSRPKLACSPSERGAKSRPSATSSTPSKRSSSRAASSRVRRSMPSASFLPSSLL
jgi:hypothetical protein